MTMMMIIKIIIYIETYREDVSGEALVSALPMAGQQGGISRARSAPDCGDVSGGLPVWLLNISRIRSRS